MAKETGWVHREGKIPSKILRLMGKGDKYRPLELTDCGKDNEHPHKWALYGHTKYANGMEMNIYRCICGAIEVTCKDDCNPPKVSSFTPVDHSQCGSEHDPHHWTICGHIMHESGKTETVFACRCGARATGQNDADLPPEHRHTTIIEMNRT